MSESPPKNLSPAARAIWRSVVRSYVLEPRHEAILRTALEAHTRMEEAQERLALEGLTVEDRYGTPKPHPCIVIERDSRAAFLRGMRELGLDLEQAPVPRPPSRWHP
jgi:P27 family predicted phage terminase small subunit